VTAVPYPAPLSSSLLRRGACPSLAAPMLTGDGWLARFSVDGGISPDQLRGIAEASARSGNGGIEITTRGSMQIRGLTAISAAALAEAIADLGIAIRSGLAIETGPLAGIDASEIADPRPLAAAIRAQAAEYRLGPKVLVAIDGGGALALTGLGADVTLEAFRDGWLVSAGGRTLGGGDAAAAVGAMLAVLQRMTHRARDLVESDFAAARAFLRPASFPLRRRSSEPVGTFPLTLSRDAGESQGALGYALAFGATTAERLVEFAAAASNASEIRLAPGRGLLVLGLADEDGARLTAAAARLGFITEPGDRRLAITACAGAPACSRGRLAARSCAADIAAGPALPFRLHIAGCAKRCAEPAASHVTLLGQEGGCAVLGNGVPGGVQEFLLARGRAHLGQ
jgi:precorrin-3B synthase